MIYLLFLLSFFCLILCRKVFVLTFKCSYYETKLENRNVDITHVKSAGLIDILKM